MNVRYEDMRVDRLLAKKYAGELVSVLNSIHGLSDIELLLSKFEKEFANYIGTNYALAVNSGTDALQLALMALGLETGDKVIIPAVTYSAVGYAVFYAGLTPVVVDVEPKRFSISVDAIESALHRYGNSIKAIIVPHMFGFPANIEGLLYIKEKYGVFIIEDVCQAESSKYNGRFLGSFFDISCFSFSYYKPISSCGGGGGMLCFNDDRYNKIRDVLQIWKDDQMLTNAGKRFSSMYLVDYVTINVKFRYRKHIINSRKNAQKWYESRLTFVNYLKEKNNEDVVLQNLPVLVKDSDKVFNALLDRGVYSLRPYMPLSEMEVFAGFVDGNCPNALSYRCSCLHLPLFSFVSEKEVEYVCEMLAEVCC